jgi:hypothetical protein
MTTITLDTGRAMHDAQGLPPKLRDLFVVEDLLKSARHANDAGGFDDDNARKHAQPLLQECESARAKLHDIIRKA